jgi:hypothetical protein
MDEEFLASTDILKQVTVKSDNKATSLNSSCFSITFKNRDEAFDALVSKVFGAQVKYTNQDRLCHDLDDLRIKHEKTIAELHKTIATLTTQRDRYNLLFSEIIAMIRVNVMRDTFKNCTIQDLEAHLEPWIKRREEVKNITF